jgi:hypothetical protein
MSANYPLDLAVVDQIARGLSSAAMRDVAALPILPAENFGVRAGTLVDQAPAINAGLAVATAQGKRLVLPDGDIAIGSPITIINFTQLEGHSYRTTRLAHMTGVTTPMFSLARDAVVQCRIGNFWMHGNEEEGEHGFHFEAQFPLVDPVHGGFWYSIFHSLYIDSFGGKAFWLQATGDSVNLLHQFITFRDVQVIRPATATSRAFSATGKVGQLYFEGVCEFDGPVNGSVTEGVGVNMVFSREFEHSSGDRGDAADAYNLADFTLNAGWSAVSDEASYGCYPSATVQVSDIGILVDRGYVTITRCYFENLDRSVISVASGTALVFSCEARNAGGWSVGDGSGFFCGVYAGTVIHGNNLITGATDSTFKRNASGSISAMGVNICSTTPALATSSKETATQVGVVGTSIDIGSATEVFVNAGTPAQFDSIISTHTTGAIITLHAIDSGGGYTVRIYDFGNNIICREIEQGGTLNLRIGDSITLQRQGEAWRIIARSIGRLTSAALPDAGFFDVAEFVWNTGSSAYTPSSGKLLLGWVRKTGGTGHVLNTDWEPVYVTNS